MIPQNHPTVKNQLKTTVITILIIRNEKFMKNYTKCYKGSISL